MNDKDKEAFEKWYTEDYAKIIWDEFNGDQIAEHTWLEACRYKQKEIDELKDRLHHEVEMIDGAARDHIKKLQAENAKLRECVKFYALPSSWNEYAKIRSEDHEFFQKWFETLGGKRARQVLKELEEK